MEILPEQAKKVFCQVYLRIRAESGEVALGGAAVLLREALKACASPEARAHVVSLRQVYLRPDADGGYRMTARIEFQAPGNDGSAEWLTSLPAGIAGLRGGIAGEEVEIGGLESEP